MVLRRNNLEIPALFSFRPRVAKWQASWAEVVSWGDGSSEMLRPLITMVVPPERHEPKNSNSVIVRVARPGMSAMLAGIYSTSPYVEIEIQRSELPDGVLHTDETPKTSPDIAGRDFFVLISQLPDSPNIFPPPKSDETGKQRNVWAMRERFFSLEPSIFELKTFLNSWGRWDGEMRYQADGLSFRSVPFDLVVPDAIWRQRDAYRKALSGSSRSWLRTARPLTFSSLDEWPHFLVERSTCKDAIEATITIDHMRGAKHGFCKRCRGMFERDTLHKKTYCSRKCIQAAATARWRASQKKQSNPKKGKTNAKG